MQKQSSCVELGEAELYEDLTQFIRVFKKVMASVETIALLLERQEDCSRHVQSLKLTVTQQFELFQSYNYPFNQHSSHQNTYFRFICRLSENLTSFKNRGFGSTEEVNLYSEYISKIEYYINTHKTEKNIGKMFKKIFTLTHKLCMSCEVILMNGSLQQAIQILNQNTQQNTDEKQKRGAVVPKNISCKTESNFNRAMNDLNRRFNTMISMELDFNYFKSTFFLARGQNNELYDDFLSRNSLVLKAYNSYSKHFQDYLKRKEKGSLVRKNKFKEIKEIINKPIKTIVMSPIKDAKRVFQMNQLEQCKNNCASKTIDLPNLREDFIQNDQQHITQKQIQANTKTIQSQKRKASYQLKNVYLTLNKKSNQFVPFTLQPNSNNQFLSQLTSSKDKNRKYPSLKASNDSPLKYPRTKEYQKVPTPLLDIRKCQMKQGLLNVDQKLFLQQTLYHTKIQLQDKSEVISKHHFSKKNISERRSIRITQIINRTTLTNKKQKSAIKDHSEFAECNISLFNPEQPSFLLE